MRASSRILALGLAIFAAACGAPDTSDGGGDAGPRRDGGSHGLPACAPADGGGTPGSFTHLYATYFDPAGPLTKCAQSGCHDSSASPSANLGLAPQDAAYTHLVNVAAMQAPATKLVNPNDPANSYLVQKLSDATNPASPANATQMPLSGCVLSSDQIAEFTAWIGAGAPNN